MIVENIIMDTNFYVGRKVKFSHPIPELRKNFKYGQIIAVYPYTLQVKSNDGKIFTLNKKDFYDKRVTDNMRASFVD